MAAGGDPNPAVAGGSGLNPTTVTPVATAATGAGKVNATTTTTTTTAATAAGAGAGAKTPGQSNLEKLLNQLGGQPPQAVGEAGDTLARTGDATTPQLANNLESALLTTAAKAQQQGAGGGRRFMNFVAIAGCTPSDGKELTFMVESKSGRSCL